MLRYTVRGGFTSGNTSFLVMNSDFHFALAMNFIVCTVAVGNVIRVRSFWVAEVLWSGLEFAMMVALSSKLFGIIECRKIQ